MAKKDSKPKLPKKVGGVKLPKDLRKTAKSAVKLAQNPLAREVVSAALVAGATALARRKLKDSGGPGTAGKPTNELDNLIGQGKEIGNILAQGVTAFFTALTKPVEAKPAPKATAASPQSAPAKPAAARPRAAKPAATKPAAAKPAAAKPAAAKRTAPPKSRAKPKPAT